MPTQWIDTDKNEHLKRAQAKAGGSWRSGTVSTDSPTVETEALNLILAWTASFSFKIKSIDITNAYLHGEKMDRLMLLKLPRGGLQDPEIPEDAMMLARIPM